MSQYDTIDEIEDRYVSEIKKLAAERDTLKSALELIATPRRPDGTYNRCREACEIIAREALGSTE